MHRPRHPRRRKEPAPTPPTKVWTHKLPPAAPPVGLSWIGPDLLSQFTESATTAHRLYSEPEAWIERLGNDALVSARDETLLEPLAAALESWAAAHHIEIRRVFGRHLPKSPGGRNAPRLLQGDPNLPLETVVTEYGARFGIDFAAGYSAGLFLDQRHNRARLASLKTATLLNTFAYTCAFSVAAALAGTATTSLDLSKKSLDRGRRNFVLNNLDPAQHQFHACDVIEWLPRLARRNERFSCVILDPPTFSRGAGGKAFRAESGLADLIVECLELLAPRGHLLIATNCAALNHPALERMARHALRVARRSAALHAEPLPPDIPAPHAATTLWLDTKD